ncbi:MAG TPA: protease pro-enzyme activation domain-containing protein [Vicinamibacterales bacterium]|nr:protease pro-enzyme activation domain-containing protein [Vicinamibacterales bacterium]
MPELPLRSDPLPASEVVDFELVLRYGESQRERLEEERQRLLAGDSPGRIAHAVRAADPSDIEAVSAFAQREGLTIVEVDPTARRMRLSGPAATVNRLFGVTLMRRSTNERVWIDYAGEVTIPRELEPIVEAVLGLTQKPAASHS